MRERNLLVNYVRMATKKKALRSNFKNKVSSRCAEALKELDKNRPSK